MLTYRCRYIAFAICALVAGGLVGCARSPSKEEIALAKAQKAVDVAFDGWTRGEPAEKFACNDPEWKAGARLVSFLTADAKVVSEKPEQVRCHVQLTLKEGKGKELQRTVAYLVELGDPITIGRDDKQDKKP